MNTHLIAYNYYKWPTALRNSFLSRILCLTESFHFLCVFVHLHICMCRYSHMPYGYAWAVCACLCVCACLHGCVYVALCGVCEWYVCNACVCSCTCLDVHVCLRERQSCCHVSSSSSSTLLSETGQRRVLYRNVRLTDGIDRLGIHLSPGPYPRDHRCRLPLLLLLLFWFWFCV